MLEYSAAKPSASPPRLCASCIWLMGSIGLSRAAHSVPQNSPWGPSDLRPSFPLFAAQMKLWYCLTGQKLLAPH